MRGGRERETVCMGGGRNCQKQLLSDQIYLDLNYTVFTLVLHYIYTRFTLDLTLSKLSKDSVNKV